MEQSTMDAMRRLIREAVSEGYAPKGRLSGGMVFERCVAVGFGLVALGFLGGVAVDIFVGLLRLANIL